MAPADNSRENSKNSKMHRSATVDFGGVIPSRRSQEQPLSGPGRRLRAFAMACLSGGTRGLVL
jgi:hypothetical protein